MSRMKVAWNGEKCAGEYVQMIIQFHQINQSYEHFKEKMKKVFLLLNYICQKRCKKSTQLK